jgi:hypothetical protein
MGALAIGLGVVGSDPPIHNTIDDIFPESGQLVVEGSTEATLSMTSVSSCLDAETDAGLEVTFSPRCGEGTWSSVMVVTHNGGPVPTGLVVISEVDANGSVVDQRSWEIQTLTTTTGPSPSSTTGEPSTSTSASATSTAGVMPPPPPAATMPDPITTIPSDGSPTTLSPDPDDPQDDFEAAGIAFNTPTRLGLDQTTKVELVLGLGQSGKDVQSSVTGLGDVNTDEINTTCKTTAQLLGQNFDVLPATPPTQFVCAGSVGRWQWDVTALKPGIHSLTLTISALIDDNPPVTIRVYSRDIEIEVGLWSQIFGPVFDNLGVAVGAFAAAIGAALAARVWPGIRRSRHGVSNEKNRGEVSTQ